ncbi:chromosome segregation protein SMC [Haliovirga abyssi]|uniref:Chromosome partition protein Smc n=1 Tax=Haliovirga abyssi TaxID=2996794 RepID=A0AAU9E1R2_9FUSO|nr:chromosome segregation protein SMC [Haliovirga abyssi]BDU50325.1 chromosome partition protein Smc [Haliovirga abyssi]
MYLKSIEISGFKSFADKTKLNLSKGITSIVGPNGSGKSNVLDAVLWALGEQSYKSIRAKEGSDVIFSGGKNSKKKGMAMVSLIIDNNNSLLDIEYNEIKITRKIFSSGENEYYINDGKVRLKDIHELFMDTGIGKKAYSVIGQGKVEEIIMSSQKELREIIEEVAGIKKIKKRKEEAEKKLEKLNDNIEKIEIIENGIVERLGPLKKQYEKAIKYRELNESLNEYRYVIYKKQKETLGISLEKIGVEKDRKLDELEKIKENFKATEENLEKQVQLKEALQNKIFEKENSLKEIETVLNINENNKILYFERENNNKKSLEKINLDIIELNTLQDTRKKEIIKLKKDVNEIENEIKKQFEILEKDKEEVDGIQIKTLNLEKSLEKSKKDIFNLEIEKAKLQNKLESKDNKVKKIEIHIKNLEIENREVIDEKHKAIEESNKIVKNIDENRSKLREIQINIDDKFEQIKELKKTVENKNVIVEELNRKLNNRILKSQALNRMNENFEGLFKGVKEIIKSNISGVISPFMDIIEIPEYLETAIVTVAGNSLQDIVVENSSVAKKCIEFLKREKKGRASFLAFDMVSKSKGGKIEKKDGILGRLSELVKYDNQYKDVVELVLGNILVVKDVNIGINIQKKRSFYGTIVTLEGEVIHSKGKISGGEKVKNGITMIFERKKEINNINEEITNIEEILVKEKQYEIKIKKDINILIDKIEELNINKSNIEDILKKLGSEKEKRAYLLNSIENKLEVIEYELKNEKNYLNEIIENSSKQNNEVKIIEEDILKLKNNILELEFKLKENRKKSEKNSGEYYEKKSKIDILKQKKEFVEKNLFDKEEQLKNVLENLNKNNSQRDIYISEIEDLEKKLLKIDEILSEKSGFLKNMQTGIEQLKEEFLNFQNLEKMKIIEIKEIEKELIKNENSYHIIIKEYEVLNDEFEQIIKKFSEVDYEGELDEALLKLPVDILKSEINKLERSINKIGEINLYSIEEYKELSKKYEVLKYQKEDLINSKKELEKLIASILEELLNNFVLAYKELKNNFSYTCQEMLGMAKGEILLTNSEDLLNTGVELKVKFNNKKEQSLSLLSGGEKSMIAVAFIMAIFMYKPSPFTFFDEIEAALDETNTKKLILMLKKFTEKSQFILITHNKETMKESDTLYGVTMDKSEGVSKLLSVDM